MAQVEASRAAEQEKWIAYYDTQHALEVARLTVLRQTGTLVAALRASRNSRARRTSPSRDTGAPRIPPG